MYEKYLRRDCKLQPELKDLCYAQFVKRYSSARKKPAKHCFKQKKVEKTYDKHGRLDKDIIITKNIDDELEVFKLPNIIRLKKTQENEPAIMKKSVLSVHT